MAKTKKTSKKNSSSSLKKLTNWLKPTTPLKGIVLFALVFAIVGGGYYAYKSHAASWTVYAPDLTLSGGSFHATDCNSNKGCISVVKLQGGLAGVAYASIFTHFSTPTTVFICTTLRNQVSSSSQSARVSISDYSDPGVIIGAHASQSFNPGESKTYHEFCGYETVNSGNHILNISVNAGANTGPPTSDTYITNVTMRY